MYPASIRPRAKAWLGEEAQNAAARPHQLTNEAHQQDAKTLWFRRWVPVIAAGSYGFQPVTVHVFSYGRRQLSVWLRVSRGNFIVLQRHLSAMIALRRRQGVQTPLVVEAAYKNLQLLSVAHAAERIRDTARSADAAVLQLFVQSHAQATPPREQQHQVRRDLTARAREINDLHRLLEGVRRPPGDLTKVEDYDPGAQNLLRARSVEQVADVLAEALEATSSAVTMYTDSLLAASAARESRFQAIAAVVASALLAPALVAGIYGANVDVPGKDTRDGFWAMGCWMAVGATVLWTTMRRFQGEPIIPVDHSRDAILGVLCLVALVLLFLAALMSESAMNLRVSMAALAVVLIAATGVADRADRR